MPRYLCQPYPPKLLQPWLSATGSLTALLEAKAGQPLQVNPIFEGFKLMTFAQKKTLGLELHPQMAWVRQVQLFGNQPQPWVEATSLFPVSSLLGQARRLRYLGKTPLGYVLFKRGEHFVRCNRHVVSTPQGWQRQNGYVWQGVPLLVQETFLPAFMATLV